MTEQEIRRLLAGQQDFYRTGATLPVDFRLAQLRRLQGEIRARERDIAAALRADLGKSPCEGYMCEVGLVLSEIAYLLRRTRKLARRRTVPTPLSQFAAHSFTRPVPYGNTLIMSPWNYPFLLTMDPLVDAIAAGNTAMVKPSAYSPATTEVVRQILSACFPPEYVAVVTGGRAENAALLEQKFDLIFFTGSQSVGREVLRRAAEHLTPVVLELGGKSPCIVDESADIPLAAKRIVFGKYLNCGQTCVAPDYLLCHAAVKDALVREITVQITAQFGPHPLENPDYGRIINDKHFRRLCGLLDDSKIIAGGQRDPSALRMAPTVMDNVTPADPVMGEEIFGPILPILTFRDFDRVVEGLKAADKPLALYLFSRNRAHIRRVEEELSYGGGCINDVVIHLATSAMGFGGVGESGMGAYHGRQGFAAFSHTKSMVDKKTWMDLPMRYQPYRPVKEKLIRMFLR